MTEFQFWKEGILTKAGKHSFQVFMMLLKVVYFIIMLGLFESFCFYSHLFIPFWIWKDLMENFFKDEILADILFFMKFSFFMIFGIL